MATKDTQSIVLLLLLSCMSVLSYLQFVRPGSTQADSSKIHISGESYHYWSNRTVDGNFSQNIKACLHTAISGVTEAWLRIDLETVKSVKSIKFWYRNDRSSDANINTERLRGYSIRVSNTTDLAPDSLDACFIDSINRFSTTIIQNDCKETARYIWFYQQHIPNRGNDNVPILEVCEVQVLGCETGTYGDNCSKSCSHCKNNLSCDIDTGECDALGCAQSGFQQPLCNDCIPGWHGSICNSRCSAFCANTSCNRLTAECINGCKPGYQQPACNQPCSLGTYGYMCKDSCGDCLNGSQSCDHVEGSCKSGCARGFKGVRCKTICSPGKYGENCQLTCSNHCYNNEICDRFLGNCSKCADGFQNIMCDEKCDNGTYGNGCAFQCGNCLDVTCNHVNGICSKGCAAGWKNTSKCDLPCENGSFGMSCKYECSGNCLNNETCNKSDGGCRSCAPGWESQLCNKTCEVGKFGSNCLTDCGKCLKKEHCSPTNGSCSAGCLPGYTGDKCAEKSQSSSDEDPETTDAGVIAAPIAVIVVLASIIVVVVIVRRRQHPEKETKTVQMQAIQDLDEEVETPAGDEVYYTNHQIHTKHIKIRELRSLIHSLEHEDGFEKEFRAIPFGEQPDIPCTVGKLPENITKNRFKTTFPYDHSRVILESTENGDYINGNFIKNAYGETAYIASQGPRANTVVHFWQMVWQENVTVIAMVTNLMEGATIKCERYWPEVDGGKIVKGKFSIQLLSTKTYANFAIHKLKLANNQIKKTRLVTHLQYTGWPDHGTPSPLELLAYHRYVSKAMKKLPESKLVVHCSAGIGRTGTFIALDALRDMGEKEGRINIVEFVHTMREDRMNMIQNANQYQFLYYVLHESFRAKGRVLSKTDFIQEVDSEIATNKAVNLSKFMKEFNELSSIKPVFEEKDLKFGKQYQSLNMTKNVLPADKMRIILSSHVPGRSTYVNAVPLSTFTMKDCLIAAQYPIQGAAVDLIRLLIDQECSFLVSINPLSEIPSTSEWFSPSEHRRELFNYEVEIMSTSKISDHVRKTNVRMKTATVNVWHDVLVYEFASWHFKDALPVETRVVLDLVKFIMQGPKIDPERKLALLSRDGAIGCGVFCAVYNAIEQLQLDGEVDMFTVVRHLQSRRPEMIASMNEYTFCCQAVAQFIKSDSGMEDVYMNSQPENDDNIYANVET